MYKAVKLRDVSSPFPSLLWHSIRTPTHAHTQQEPAVGTTATLLWVALSRRGAALYGNSAQLERRIG